ncbi:MAG: HD domain-containing protein [Patescibacteria group bacterium]|jgi:(p)ppGpp synthase/HD superfamily hydrolase
MQKKLNIEFEKAVRLLATHFPLSDTNSRKPILFHSIRVGVYLYEKSYAQEIVLAGLLHDALEWSNITKDLLRSEFGDHITRLILANTKNDTITDNENKTNELIQRCVQAGQDALIVKTADIIDSYKWYTNQKNAEELNYCTRCVQAIFKFKPATFNDLIFKELKSL